MTLGSLFDGIGGWLLAARHAGVTPLWASEIEPFPCSVTAYHFPGVTKMGDIMRIAPDEIEPVDIVPRNWRCEVDCGVCEVGGKKQRKDNHNRKNAVESIDYRSKSGKYDTYLRGK